MIVPSEDQAYEKWLDQALDYILGPNGNPRKRNKLARHLQKRASWRPSGITVKEIEQLPLPALPPIEGFRFNYSLSDLLRIAEEYTHNSPRDVNRVMRYAMIMCGIRIGDTRSLASVHLDSGYAPGKRFPRVTGSVHSKRLSMRVVPNQGWGGPGSPHRPHFILTSEPHRRILIDNKEIACVRLLFFDSPIDCIAYLTKTRDDQYCITVNPLHKSPADESVKSPSP